MDDNECAQRMPAMPSSLAGNLPGLQSCRQVLGVRRNLVHHAFDLYQ